MTRRRRVGLAALALLGAPLLAQPPPEPAKPATPLGAPAGWVADEPQTLILPAGSELRAEPSPLSRLLVRLEATTEVAVLEESGGWVRVRVAEVRGWVPVDASAFPAASSEVGLGEDLRRLRAARLERARSLLVDGRVVRAGTVEWWTDLHPDSRLHERVAGLIECFADAYAERYGLDLAAWEEPDLMVVFVQQEAYRRFTEEEAEVADLASGGFSATGFAALFTGARHADDVAAIAAHELAHLENRRRLALELPPWLEEGLAEDMALAAAASRGCPQAGAWPVVSRRQWRAWAGRDGREEEVRMLATMSGKLRGLACTLESWGRSGPDLRELATLDWARFVRPQGRSARYHTSALLVRFLLDPGADPSGGPHQGRDAFRAFLRAGRDAASFDFDDLLERLAIDETGLARSLARWARAELGELPCARPG